MPQLTSFPHSSNWACTPPSRGRAESSNLVVDAGARTRTDARRGHTDVVTAGDRAAWSVDPFGAAVVDGRLYGRGACDMKGGLVAMLFAARALQLSGCDYAGCVRLAIMVDEEGMMSARRRSLRTVTGWRRRSDHLRAGAIAAASPRRARFALA